MSVSWIQTFTACLTVDVLCMFLGQPLKLSDLILDGAIATLVVSFFKATTNQVSHRVYISHTKNNWLIKMVAIACGTTEFAQAYYGFDSFEQAYHFSWLLNAHYPIIFEPDDIPF